jgi:type 1 glutamine amidotransferase
MKRNLLIAGGIYHPFEESSAALDRLLQTEGIETEISFDIEGALARLATERFDLLTMNCLRWSMVQNEKYVPFREQWAMSLSMPARAAIVSHLRRGGGLLGMHTASICFDDWPEWKDLLGVAWRWGRSQHPALQPISVAIEAASHPITKGLEGFEVADELYCDLDQAAGLTILARGHCESVKEPRPVAFARDQGLGRSVYLSLGHDTASIENRGNAALIAASARWLCYEAPTAEASNFGSRV